MTDEPNNQPTPDPQSLDPMDEARAEAEALDYAQRFFDACSEGVLYIDGENPTATKFIVEPEEGRLIFACPVAAFFAEELVLFVPDDSEDAMKLLLSAEQVEESALTDRWCAFHGEPEHVRWADCWIDSVKHGPWVLDGDAMMRPNTIAADENAAIKALNADAAVLTRALKAAGDIEAESPVAVGVDDRGVLIRVRFGVVRVPFEVSVGSGAEAVEKVRVLAGER